MKNSLIVFLTLVFGIASAVFAQAPNVPTAPTTGAGIQAAVAAGLTISSGIAAVFYIIAGLIFCFFGYHLFRFVLLVIGFYIGSTIAYIVLLNVQPSSGWQNGNWIFFAVCIIVGVVFAVFFMCFWLLGVAGLGAFGGFLLAVWILSLKSGGLIPSQVGQIIFMVALAIVGLVLALIFQRIGIIIATSVVGAVSTLIGIDVFAQTGVSYIIISFISNPSTIENESISGAQYGILAGMAVLALLGMLWQFYHNRGKGDTHKQRHFYSRTNNNQSKA